MPILTLCPISPGSWSSRPSHKGPSRQRSSPSSPRSIRNATASLPGPRARSRKRSTPRFQPHDRDTFHRFNRPDQDAGSDPGHLAGDVQHEGDTVGEVNIGVPGLEKQRTIARGHPPVGVPGGIPDNIRLGLNDTAADDAFRQHPHQHFANEIVRQIRPYRSASPSGRAPEALRGVRISARPIAHAKAPARTDRRNTGSLVRPSRRGTP